jgi:hypothetical protein
VSLGGGSLEAAGGSGKERKGNAEITPLEVGPPLHALAIAAYSVSERLSAD